MKDIIQTYAEMVENEFPNMEWEELFDKVWTLICQQKNKFFNGMNDADKFDYLVDGIIEMTMEEHVSEMEKRTNMECR